MALKNFKNRYKIWKIWRINNRNSKFHQWLVLFKLKPSPTFENFEAWYYVKEGFRMWERVWPEPTYIGLDMDERDLEFNHDPGMYNVIGKVDSIECLDNGIKVNVLEERKDYD